MDVDSSIGGGWAKDTKPDAQLKETGNMKDGEMSNAEPGGPLDGFQFVLPFLDLPSRLNVERVNKPLREALKDPLLWVDLTIEWPAVAIGNLTNEVLLKLVERADGHLKSLFLVDALAITDEILSRISELNPGLERISVPGCTGLEVVNFVSLVEAHSLRARENSLPGISQVRLRGLYTSPEHLLRLENALGVSRLPQNEAPLSRRYYGNRKSHNEATEKRPVDVELCPNCENVRIIYDCPTEDEDHNDLEQDEYINRYGKTCVIKGKPCRACRPCIPRCEECGTCIESMSSDDGMCTLCIGCWFALPKCNSCHKPVCSHHVEDYFPDGYDEPSISCHDEAEYKKVCMASNPDDMFPIYLYDSDWEDDCC